MKPGQYSIPVVTRLQDNGDGGYSMYVYASEEEMLADHPLASDGEVIDEKIKKAILTEDDPYENGYIGTDTINIVVTTDGKLLLAKPLHFHAGQ